MEKSQYYTTIGLINYLKMIIYEFARFHRKRFYIFVVLFMVQTFSPFVILHLLLLQGANFRDLPGVVVGPDNVVLRDPTKEKMMLPSGKPMVSSLLFLFRKRMSLMSFFVP